MLRGSVQAAAVASVRRALTLPRVLWPLSSSCRSVYTWHAVGLQCKPQARVPCALNELGSRAISRACSYDAVPSITSLAVRQAWCEAPSGEGPAETEGYETEDWLTETSERCRPASAGSAPLPHASIHGVVTGAGLAAPARDLLYAAEALSEGAQSSLHPTETGSTGFDPAGGVDKDEASSHKSTLGVRTTEGERHQPRVGSSATEHEAGAGQSLHVLAQACSLHLEPACAPPASGCTLAATVRRRSCDQAMLRECRHCPPQCCTSRWSSARARSGRRLTRGRSATQTPGRLGLSTCLERHRSAAGPCQSQGQPASTYCLGT